MQGSIGQNTFFVFSRILSKAGQKQGKVVSSFVASDPSVSSTVVNMGAHMPPLFRNWPAICAIDDPYLLVFLSTTTDEALLRQVASGLPGVLVEKKPEHEGARPLSVIRRVCATMHGNSSHAEQLTERLGIPVIRAMSARHTPSEWEKKNVLLSEPEERELTEEWEDKLAFPDGLDVFWLIDRKYYVFNIIKEDVVWVDLIPVELVNENA
jgi:hypothetical protein